MNGNYEKIIERIAKSSGLEKNEIERKIEAKRAKLSGLISREGAAQVICAELGINLDKEKLKIGELLPSMRKVNTIGKVISISPVRKFTRNNKESKVVNLFIADESSNVRVVLWDENHIDLIEKKQVKEGDVVEVSNGNMRNNEIHLGGFSEFKKVNKELGEVVTEKIVKPKKISELNVSESVSLRAFVVQAFEPKTFEVCPECKKRAFPQDGGFVCKEHGKVTPEKRALINFVLDDGSESIRSVMFSDNFSQVGITDLEDPSLLSQQKNNLLGKEMFFNGDVRNNKFFNNSELIVDSVKEVNLDELINELEKG